MSPALINNFDPETDEYYYSEYGEEYDYGDEDYYYDETGNTGIS